MGLDMYLERRVFVGAHYGYRKVQGHIDIVAEGKPVNVDFNKVYEIVERAVYWRKANQIHNWFVEHVQGGKDDCKVYSVKYDKLMVLRDLCKFVLDTGKFELLPPREGFFFGSTEIDEWYLQDLRHTVESLNSLPKEGDYYYYSSW